VVQLHTATACGIVFTMNTAGELAATIEHPLGWNPATVSHVVGQLANAGAETKIQPALEGAATTPDTPATATEPGNVALVNSVLVDVNGLNMDELMTTGSPLVKSLERIAEQVDDEAIAGFSQGLA